MLFSLLQTCSLIFISFFICIHFLFEFWLVPFLLIVLDVVIDISVLLNDKLLLHGDHIDLRTVMFRQLLLLLVDVAIAAFFLVADLIHAGRLLRRKPIFLFPLFHNLQQVRVSLVYEVELRHLPLDGIRLFNTLTF